MFTHVRLGANDVATSRAEGGPTIKAPPAPRGAAGARIGALRRLATSA